MIDASSVQRTVVESPSPGLNTSKDIVLPIWALSPFSAMQKVQTLDTGTTAK